ncbi:bromodomain-containing protein 4A-like, partial [Phlebotomus argentipes]|uniref:bromodomain-containing protein 4A-like n=1 Tax=Phlebotomus argentipes TaxID=94469 RepID=UPI002892FC02
LDGPPASNSRHRLRGSPSPARHLITGHPASRIGRPTTPQRRPLPVPRGPSALTRRPPLPPTISSRSQSLDGLLDMAGCEEANGEQSTSERAASEVPDTAQRRARGAETDRTNRISRSLEDLLDEKPGSKPETVVEDGNCSRSLESLLQDPPESPTPASPSPGEKFCESETMVVDNTLKSNDDTAYNSEEDKSSTSSRQGSISSEPNKKTFINRLGRRMKSLIKK